MPLPDEDLWSENFRGRERDRLLDQVSLGEMSPQEAEDEAKEKGVGPFAVRPDPALHDPLKKPFWTLAMALAWIVYRDPSQVMEWDNEFRGNWMEWRPLGPGHELRPVTLVDGKRFEEWGAISADPDQTPEGLLSKIATAKAELWSMLTDGKLVASGFAIDRGELVPISRIQWVGLINHRIGYAGGPEPFSLSAAPRRMVYRDLLFERSKIVRLWQKSSPAPKNLNKKDLIQKIRSLTKGGDKKPTKKELEEWALQEGYRRDSFRKAYESLPAEYRYKQGERASAFP